VTDSNAARGKQARTTAPRSVHARWQPAPDRADPVEVLARQDETRTPALVPIRHERMLTSPFAFFRGAAAIMAADLAYGEICGWTLARAHARTGDRAALAAYLGGSDRFDNALATFAEAYADQNERDYAAFASAANAARRAKPAVEQEKPIAPRAASTVGGTRR
jgi:Uncharacterized protein conserved in bacteria (DUF2252)